MSNKVAAHPTAIEGRKLRFGSWMFDLPPSICLFILFVLPFIVFWAEALGLSVFYHHDLQYYFFPYHKLVVDITAQGYLPLWNPYAFSGIPLIGDGQTAMFYPPNWIFWLLPPAHALTVVVLLQFSIAGAGMFAYVRSLGLGRLAAFVAAIAFMFNGFLVVRVVHLSIMAGAALIPAVFWGMERLLQRRSVGSFILAATMVCLQALAGHPQVPIYTAVALGVYVVVVSGLQWRRRAGWRKLVPLAQLTGIYAGGYALAAIQLVPWVELATFSPRAAGASYEFVTGQSWSGLDWLMFLFPYGYGGVTTNWFQTQFAWDLPVYIWERLAYVGILPLALALVGLAQLRRRPNIPAAADTAQTAAARLHYERLWAIVAVLLVTGLIAAGSSTPFGRLVYILPAIGKLRAYARAIAVTCFALAALAAFGIERLVRRPRTRAAVRTNWGAPFAGLLLLSVIWLTLFVANVVGAASVVDTQRAPMFGVMLDQMLQLDQANAYVPLALATLSVGVLWWLSRGVNWGNAAMMIGLVAFDLLSFAATFNPTTNPAALTGEPPSVAFLKRDPALYRTAAFIFNDRLRPEVAQSQLALSWGMAYGIEEINGFNSLQPRRYTDVLFGPEVEDVSYGYLRDGNLLNANNNLLSMLNVKYALIQAGAPLTVPVPVDPSRPIADQEQQQPAPWIKVFQDATVTIYRNTNVFDRAFFVDRVAALPEPRTILELIRQPGFDPRRQSFVENGLTQDQAVRLSRPGPASVRVERVSPNELRLDTETTTDRFLMLSEMWMPGWRAEIDGQTMPMYRTNYLFRGLAIPAGKHTVRMVYQPGSALLGAGVTAATMLGLAGALIVARRRRSLTH